MKYKAKLVVKGFQKKEGIDYTKIFLPIVKLTRIRTILGLVMKDDLHLQQMDIQIAFPHGNLEEVQGFKVRGRKDLVCKVQKSLYGLEQAPYQW